MKILFSLTYYSPYVSGLTLYIKRLAEKLIKSGYAVSVITMQHDKKLSVREKMNGVDVVRASYLKKISKGFISFDWIILCWRHVRASDVVVLNMPQFEAIIPALFAKLLQKPLISIYQCDVVLPEGLGNKVVEKILQVSHLISLSFSWKIITHTEDFANHSSVLRHFTSKLMYVYPPIDILIVNKRVQKMINDKIGSKPDFLIGVAARLAAEKGIEYLIEAVPKLQQLLRPMKKTFKIIIAGPIDPVGEEKYREKIFDLIQKNKDHVVLLGEIRPEDMGAFYALLDVLVIPSVNSTDSIATVQLEAMVSGVPVVATDLPGIRIPIEKTGMGKIVSPKNSNQLADAIIDILHDSKKYSKNIQKARDEFSADKTVDFYKKIFLLTKRNIMMK